MSSRVTQAALAFVVVFAAAQFVRPGRENPATDPSRTIQAHTGTTGELVAVLDRACRDCHSNQTVWPAYTQIAPLSWVMAYAAIEGRRAVNFSEWAGYPVERQRELLRLSCKDASNGKMPGSPWTFLHPEAQLSPQDIAVICDAEHQVTPNTGGSL